MPRMIIFVLEFCNLNFMAELSEIVEQLSQKVTVLVSKYNTLEAEKQAISVDNMKLKERMELREQYILELEKRNELIRMAKTLQDSGESPVNVKQRINELVRGIDKCIAQLNE